MPVPYAGSTSANRTAHKARRAQGFKSTTSTSLSLFAHFTGIMGLAPAKLLALLCASALLLFSDRGVSGIAALQARSSGPECRTLMPASLPTAGCLLLLLDTRSLPLPPPPVSPALADLSPCPVAGRVMQQREWQAQRGWPAWLWHPGKGRLLCRLHASLLHRPCGALPASLVSPPGPADCGSYTPSPPYCWHGAGGV